MITPIDRLKAARYTYSNKKTQYTFEKLKEFKQKNLLKQVMNDSFTA